MIPPLQRGERIHEKRSFRLGKLPPKGGTTNFSILALADPYGLRDRAAPLTRRLAAGVGSGIAPTRRKSGGVGAAPLNSHDPLASAQYERVLGCAVVTTEKIGGRDVSRLALRRSNVAQTQKLYSRGHAFTGARRRREHGDLSTDRRGAFADAAGQKPAGIGRSAPHGI